MGRLGFGSTTRPAWVRLRRLTLLEPVTGDREIGENRGKPIHKFFKIERFAEGRVGVERVQRLERLRIEVAGNNCHFQCCAARMKRFKDLQARPVREQHIKHEEMGRLFQGFQSGGNCRRNLHGCADAGEQTAENNSG